MRTSVFLDELTDPVVSGYLRGYPATVLVPTGATEQHGAHGPLGTDVIIAREVCRRVAEAKSALVAPAIPYGMSGRQRGFKGVASLRVETFVSVIEEVALSLAEAGFRRVIFVNGTDANYASINHALLNVSGQLPDKTRAFALTHWEALPKPRRDEYMGVLAGFHANAGETSATLGVRPDTVEMGEAEPGWPRFPKLQGTAMPTILAYFETREGSRYEALPGGVWGDPTEASVEAGDAYLEEIATAVCDVIDDTEKTFAQMKVAQKY